MPTEAQYVFDANSIVSALLLPNSVPRQAFDLACGLGTLLLSPAIINELDDVLRRPKLERYVKEAERIHFLVALIRESRVVDVTLAVTDCRDPKDDKYLALAVEGEAACIVSGDEDLLVLTPYRGIPIMTSRQFLDQYPPS